MGSSSELELTPSEQRPETSSTYKQQLEVKSCLHDFEEWIIEMLRKCFGSRLQRLLQRCDKCISCALVMATLLMFAGGIFAVNAIHTNEIYHLEHFDLITSAGQAQALCAKDITNYIAAGSASGESLAASHPPDLGAPVADVADCYGATVLAAHLAAGGANATADGLGPRVSDVTKSALVAILSVQLPFTLVVRAALQDSDVKEASGWLLRGILMLFLKIFEAIFRNNHMLRFSDYVHANETSTTLVGTGQALPDGCKAEGTFTINPGLPSSLGAQVPLSIVSAVLYLGLLVIALRPATKNDNDTEQFLIPRWGNALRRLWKRTAPRSAALFILTVLFALAFCTLSAVVFAHQVQRDASTFATALQALTQYSVADLRVLFRGNPRLHEDWWASPYLAMSWISNVTFVLDALQLIISRLLRLLEEVLDKEKAGGRGERLSMRDKIRKTMFGSWRPDSLMEALHAAIRLPIYAAEVFVLHLIRTVSRTVVVVAFRVSQLGYCVMVFTFAISVLTIAIQTSPHMYRVQSAYDVALVSQPQPGSQLYHLWGNSSAAAAEQCSAVLADKFVAAGGGEQWNASAPRFHADDVQPSLVSSAFGGVVTFLFLLTTIAALIRIRIQLHKDKARSDEGNERTALTRWTVIRGRILHLFLALCGALCCSYMRNAWLLAHSDECEGYIFAITDSGVIQVFQTILVVIFISYAFIMTMCFSFGHNDHNVERVIIRGLPQSANWRWFEHVVESVLWALNFAVAASVLVVPFARLVNTSVLDMLPGSSRILQLTFVDVGFRVLPEETSVITVLRYVATITLLLDVLTVVAMFVRDASIYDYSEAKQERRNGKAEEEA